MQESPETKIIIISGQEDIKVAIDLFKKGAHDYIQKDADTQQRLWMAIQNLRETIELKKEVESLKKEVEKKYDFQHSIIGNSYAIKKIFSLMEKAIINQYYCINYRRNRNGKRIGCKINSF